MEDYALILSKLKTNIQNESVEEIKKDLSGMIDLAKETIKNLEVKE